MNPDDWPNVDLKPSKGSVKGQRYVGHGGEKTDNLGELTVEIRTERGGSDISSRVTLQGAMVRKPLAVSGVMDKGNIVVSDGSGSFILPSSCAGVASVRKAITGVQGRIPLHAKNGVFVLRTWSLRTGRRRISFGGVLKGPRTRLSKPGRPTRNTVEGKIGCSW